VQAARRRDPARLVRVVPAETHGSCVRINFRGSYSECRDACRAGGRRLLHGRGHGSRHRTRAPWAARARMRKAERARLTWAGYDRETGVVRLPGKDATTGEPRRIVLGAAASGHRAAGRGPQGAPGVLTHLPQRGAPGRYGDARKSWKRRAGVSQTVAMRISGQGGADPEAGMTSVRIVAETVGTARYSTAEGEGRMPRKSGVRCHEFPSGPDRRTLRTRRSGVRLTPGALDGTRVSSPRPHAP